MLSTRITPLERKELTKINVKIRKLHAAAVLPQYATDGAAAFDLVAVEDVIIAPGETAKVPLGLAFEIPIGYVMIVAMRSGIAFKTKLRQPNGIGVIDSDYRGEVSMVFDNTTQKEYEIIDGEIYADATFCLTLIDGSTTLEEPINCVGTFTKPTYWIRCGDRVAQAFIQPLPRINFVESAELSETERGSGGFGSTGVNVQQI